MFQCWDFRGKLVRDSLDHSKQFGTRIISVAICYGSVHRMTGLNGSVIKFSDEKIFFQLTGPFVDEMIVVPFPQAKRSTTQ